MYKHTYIGKIHALYGMQCLKMVRFQCSNYFYQFAVDENIQNGSQLTPVLVASELRYLINLVLNCKVKFILKLINNFFIILYFSNLNAGYCCTSPNWYELEDQKIRRTWYVRETVLLGSRTVLTDCPNRLIVEQVSFLCRIYRYISTYRTKFIAVKTIYL